MYYVWLALFILSLSLLVVTLIRRKHAWNWLGYAALHVVVAAFLLYFVNLAGAMFDFRIPINIPTVATAIVLGAPGILMLIGLKLLLY